MYPLSDVSSAAALSIRRNDMASSHHSAGLGEEWSENLQTAVAGRSPRWTPAYRDWQGNAVLGLQERLDVRFRHQDGGPLLLGVGEMVDPRAAKNADADAGGGPGKQRADKN